MIVWADKDEIRRLRQLATRKNSWIAARHPKLVRSQTTLPQDRNEKD